MDIGERMTTFAIQNLVHKGKKLPNFLSFVLLKGGVVNRMFSSDSMLSSWTTRILYFKSTLFLDRMKLPSRWGPSWERCGGEVTKICNLVVVVMFPTTTNDQCPLRLHSKIVTNPVNYCRAFQTKGKAVSPWPNHWGASRSCISAEKGEGWLRMLCKF